MTGAVLGGLLVPWISAWVVVHAVWPDRGRMTVLQAALAFGVAVGFTSIGYIAWLVLIGPPGLEYIVTELTVATVTGLAAWRATPRPAGPGLLRPRWTRLTTGLTAAGVLIGVLYAANFLGFYRLIPHGIEDAVSIWNLRARFLYRGADHWQDAFSEINWHTDYPLLVPATVARCWTYAGEDTPAVAAAVAFAFSTATVVLLASALAAVRGPVPAVLGAAVLLAHQYYVETAASQLADVPLAMYLLGGGVCLVLHDARGGRGWVLPGLAGLMIGFGAWTKNEGLLHLAAVLAARAATSGYGRWREFLRESAAFAGGLLPAAAALAWLKLGPAPQNDLVAAQGGGPTAARLGDVARHLTIFHHLVGQLFSIGPGLLLVLAGYAALLGRRPGPDRPPRGTFLPLVVLLVAVGYYLAYLTSPHNLNWHLDASLGRLIVHLWPLAVFVFFVRVATPTEARLWVLGEAAQRPAHGPVPGIGEPAPTAGGGEPAPTDPGARAPGADNVCAGSRPVE